MSLDLIDLPGRRRDDPLTAGTQVIIDISDDFANVNPKMTHNYNKQWGIIEHCIRGYDGKVMSSRDQGYFYRLNVNGESVDWHWSDHMLIVPEYGDRLTKPELPDI